MQMVVVARLYTSTPSATLGFGGSATTSKYVIIDMKASTAAAAVPKTRG